MGQSFLQSIGEMAITINWSAWVSAVATIVLAVLTFVYVRLTGKILDTQSDPCVILTVVHDEERATILQLVARNVGTGLAQDIRFEFSRPLPARAFGLSKDDAKETAVMADGPLIDGIPVLGPSECRKIDWGQYGGLIAALGDKPIIATCKFKKNGKDMPPTQCPLEVTSFVGTVAVESSSAKAARELEKLVSFRQVCAGEFFWARADGRLNGE
jgi:hypothetical protein